MTKENPIRHDLFEYIGEVVIKKEGIDIDTLEKDPNFRMVVARDGTFDFKDEVFEGDKIKISTSAEVVGARLRFNQRMTREGVEVFNLQCKIAVINVTGEPQRLPDEIKDKINQANLTKQTKR